MSIILHALIFSLTPTVLVVISVAFFTPAERKVMAAVQRRKGPNIVGVWVVVGLLQPNLGNTQEGGPVALYARLHSNSHFFYPRLGCYLL
jgi:hypothetical protein